MRKKALIFNPYLDTLGGGEFYSFLMGEFLLRKGFKVELAWFNKDILNQFKKRFDLDFRKRIKINSQAFSVLKKKGNFKQRYFLTRDYQLIFFVSDGSIPLLFGKKNWLLFQAPFTNVKGSSILNQWKLKNINQVFCYSQFVKNFIDKEFKIKSEVVYPSISNSFLKKKRIVRKENIILSVGRFDEALNSKRQDVLIKVFKKMQDQGLTDWQLILIGGLKKENSSFRKLKKSTKNYPIKIISNASFQVLMEYYQKAKIYWHGTGYGQDLNLHPEKGEHFGITVLEAMSYGTVPLVFNGGGLPEIIEDNFLIWKTTNELIKKTKELINDPFLLINLEKASIKRAKIFNQKKLFSDLNKLF